MPRRTIRPADAVRSTPRHSRGPRPLPARRPRWTGTATAGESELGDEGTQRCSNSSAEHALDTTGWSSVCGSSSPWGRVWPHRSGAARRPTTSRSRAQIHRMPSTSSRRTSRNWPVPAPRWCSRPPVRPSTSSRTRSSRPSPTSSQSTGSHRSAIRWPPAHNSSTPRVPRTEPSPTRPCCSPRRRRTYPRTPSTRSWGPLRTPSTPG